MKTRSREELILNRLDAGPYAEKSRKTHELVEKALAGYENPRVSLTELRKRLDKELRRLSLTEAVLKERESGW